MGRLKIKVKLITVNTLLIFTAFIGISFYNYYSDKNELTERILKHELPIYTNNIYLTIQNKLSEGIVLSSVIANSSFIKDWLSNGEQNPEQITDYLAQLHNNYDITAVYIISEEKRLVYSSIKGVERKFDETTDKWFFDFKKKKEAKEFDININKSTDSTHLALFIDTKIFDKNNKFLGTADVALDLPGIIKFITSHKIGHADNIFMINTDGDIQIHKNEALTQIVNGELVSKNIADVDGIKSIKDKILSHQNGTFEYNTSDDDKIYVKAHFIPEFDWYLIIEVSEKELLTPIQTLLFRNILIGAIVTLLIIISSIWSIQRIVIQPLYIFQEGISRFFAFLNRNSADVLPIEIKTQDEFGKMANMINRNIHHIKHGILQDNRLLEETQKTIKQIQMGFLTTKLQTNAYNPELSTLRNDINKMIDVLQEKVGKDINEILKIMTLYGAMNFSEKIQNPTGEIEKYVMEMGQLIAFDTEKIKDQNKFIKQKN